MKGYSRRFAYAALVYLGLAAACEGLGYLTDLGPAAGFAHLHFNLLGFISMAAYSLAYFALPSFAGRALRYPHWIPWHFWLANVSLISMVTWRGLELSYGSVAYTWSFAVSAAVQVATVGLFVVHVWLTLTRPGRAQSNALVPRPSQAPAERTKERPTD
ncbi:MAG TPA: hypothetical protein VMY05_08360 [Acidobacteriota bacterium]|nr:hypothetical protein [Acidobacteriota bacterium]